MKLSIIIPAYNEQNTIKQLIDYIRSVEYPIEYEIIIIDDASIDRTYDKEFFDKENSRGGSDNIRIFKNNVNRGKGFSIRKGLKEAKGDIVIIQDADIEYDPREIPKLIKPIINGESMVVYGSRFLGKTRPEGMIFPNWVANKILTILTNLLFATKLTDMETCYKAIRTDITKDLKLRANRFTFEPEITALLAKRKNKIKEIPISYHGRTAKEGKKIKAKDFIFAIMMLLWQRVTR